MWSDKTKQARGYPVDREMVHTGAVIKFDMASKSTVIFLASTKANMAAIYESGKVGLL